MGSTKKKSSTKTKSMVVRQPNKQGVERFIDPAYAKKLGDVESQFAAMMAERAQQGRDTFGHGNIISDEASNFNKAT